jgi:hypothetical protein
MGDGTQGAAESECVFLNCGGQEYRFDLLKKMIQNSPAKLIRLMDCNLRYRSNSKSMRCPHFLPIA